MALIIGLEGPNGKQSNGGKIWQGLAGAVLATNGCGVENANEAGAAEGQQQLEGT